MPIFISLLPKNMLFIKKLCASGAWRWKRGKFGGEPFENFPAEKSPNFSQNSGLKWEGNFPEPVNLSIHQRIDIKTSLGYFFTTGPLMTLWNFAGNMREISVRKYPWWFSREKRGNYPHRKFSLISPEYLQGNNEEISTGMNTQESPNLGYIT